MKTLSSFALFASLALGVFAVGCASPSDDSDNASDTAAVSSSELSQPMLCALVADAGQQDGTGMKSMKEDDLKGDSLKDFKSFQKGMASDYPSSAYEYPFKYQGKTYNFILVIEENDGGGYLGIYKTDGGTVATMSQSESGTADWSKPADKCGS